LDPSSYEAYCLDEAVWYFGTIVQSEVEKAGQKKVKGQARTESARKRVLDKYLTPAGKGGSGFADPAALLKT
jgi:hypothetical protein